MTVDVCVPDLGEYTDVPVIEILVAVGDEIAEEDSLIAIESEKATMEIPAPAAGRITEVLLSVGDVVNTGDLILKLEPASATTAAISHPAEALLSEPAQIMREAPATASTPQNAAADGRAVLRDTHAGPSVRRLARELEVDLAAVKGSGSHGRVTKEDLKAHLVGPGVADPTRAGVGIPPVPVVDFSKFGPVESVEMSRIKKLSGTALHRSWLNVPHVTHNDEADIAELEAYRKELDEEAKSAGYRVTLLSFLIKASVSALREHWEVNSSLVPAGGALFRKNFYNIAFAADTPQGLVVPVIKNADRKGLKAVSIELAELSSRARDGKLTRDDLEGATFTISSLGGVGGTSFTPIVNAPEVAILGVSRAKLQPVWQDNAFAPRLMLPLSLSYDHRAIDGALAARFLVTFKYLLADVRRLLH